jgi:hypothetical protein
LGGGFATPARADNVDPLPICPIDSPELHQFPSANEAGSFVLDDLNGDGGADVAIRVRQDDAYCGVSREATGTALPRPLLTNVRIDVRAGATGALLWSTPTDIGADVLPLDLGAGRHGVLVLDRNLRIFGGDGTQWTRQLNLGTEYQIVKGAAGEADLIVYRATGATARVRAISASTGKTVWNRPDPGGQMTVVGNINGDNRQDVLFLAPTINGAEVATVVSGTNGATWWTRQLTSICPLQDDSGGLIVPSYYVFGAGFEAGDLSGDGFPEIALHSTGCPAQFTHTFGPLYAAVLDGLDGHERWVKRGQPFRGGDSNGDGKPEVVVSDRSAYTSSHAEVTLELIDGNGTVVSSVVDAIDTGGPYGGPTSEVYKAGDVDGDGTPDVVERLRFRPGSPYAPVLHIRSGRTLAVIGPDPNPAAAYGSRALLASTDGAGDDFFTYYTSTNTPKTLDVIDAGTGVTRWSYAGGPTTEPWVTTGDVNGDNKADLIVTRTFSTNYESNTHIDIVDGASGVSLWNFVALPN